MAEKDVLVESLRDQRSAVLAKVDGLSEQQARAVVVPSGWSFTDVVHHLSVGEAYWIRAILCGEAVEFDPDDPAGSWAWNTPPDVTLDAAVAIYRAEAARTDAHIAMMSSLDTPPARLPHWSFTHHWAASARTILVHLIEETARHAGHLDVARELLDGRVRTLADELTNRT